MRVMAVLCVALVLALAACGDDDEAGGVTPTPSAAPSATASPVTATGVAAPEQLSYIGPDGEIRLVNADGTGDRVLASAPCQPGERTGEFSMAWSPDAARMGFVCVSETITSLTLVVLDSNGDLLVRVPDTTRFRWSPDSTRMAYQTLLEPFDVGLVELESGETETVHLMDPYHPNAVLMEWVGPDSLLLGLEPLAGDLVIDFKAHLFDVESRESTPMPEFDSNRMLWVSPDGARAITSVAPHPALDVPGTGMAVYDFAQDLFTVIEGASIGYPSEFVPHEQLAFSPDGGTIYWANAAEAPATVWQASVAAPTAIQLGEMNSLFVAVSPSGRVAAVVPPEEAGWATSLSRTSRRAVASRSASAGCPLPGAPSLRPDA